VPLRERVDVEEGQGALSLAQLMARDLPPNDFAKEARLGQLVARRRRHDDRELSVCVCVYIYVGVCWCVCVCVCVCVYIYM
jgi:hypothetical protein